MRVNIEILQIKISKLRQLVAECPAPGDVREEIKEILEVAPDMLQIAEDAIQSNDPLVLGHISESLKKIEIDIEWAVGTVKGERTVQSIKEGTSISPELPAIERLNNRLMTFMMGIIEQKEYLAMFEEFGGEVEGQTAYMDNAQLRRKILEVTGKKEDSFNKNKQQKEIDPQKLKIASEIDAFVKNLKKLNQHIIGSPDILEYMTKFRTLMDTSIQEELDYLSAKYEGFYEFAQFLENFASAIQNGDFDDQL